jgi:hypothetical protein
MDLPVKQLVISLLLCSCAFLLWGLEPLPPCNPLLISTGGLTTLTDDPANTLANPVAGDGGISTSTSIINGMKQLSQFELASVVSYQGNSMYAAWQALNNDDYTRQDIRFGIRYSYKFFRLGVGYKLLYDEIPGYGSDKDDRLDMGLRLKYKQTTLDIGSENRLPVEDEPGEDYCDYSIILGQSLEKSLALAMGFNTIHNEDANFKLGCRYQIYKNFQGITSWSSNPGQFGIGVVFSVKSFNLAYSLQTHPELDWTHSVGISAMFP